MPKIPGADARQSRTLQSLDRFTPAGIEALACVGLALLDCLNREVFVINDDLSFDRFSSAWNLRSATYPLQDALHGASDQLPAALAEFLSTVEEEKNHG